ncbi:MAG: hypothetical protein QOJ57_1383 [Thermoleophilaceae bacterium]|jgi:hypothetical protein|nr:hypothetical protein [Thermoleophilaceae bacterium]
MVIRRRIALLVAVFGTAVATGPSASWAATLDVRVPRGASHGSLSYRGDAAERNRLTVIVGRPRTDNTLEVVLIDPGARRIGHGGSYRAIDGLRGLRRVVRAPVGLYVDLGRGDDRFKVAGRLATRLGPRPAASVRDPISFLDPNPYDPPSPRIEVHGGPGDDVLSGSSGFDLLDGGSGSDTVDGGAGADVILDRPDQARDRIFGGSGRDSVDVTGPRSVRIDLRRTTVTARGDKDILDSIEAAHGGDGPDRLLGSGRADGLFGDGGGDIVRGGGGDDLVSGDQPRLPSDSSHAGRDVLDGGRDADVIDGREVSYAGYPPPIDDLLCGVGSDRVIATVEDVADRSCEAAIFGQFYSPWYAQRLDARTATGVQPVRRDPDGSPTYSVGCTADRDWTHDQPCSGRLQLQQPPSSGSSDGPEVLGSADFTIPVGQRADVTVKVTPEGAAALAAPGAVAAVRVLVGAAVYRADGRDVPPDFPWQAYADFGWQQRLGP